MPTFDQRRLPAVAAVAVMLSLLFVRGGSAMPPESTTTTVRPALPPRGAEALLKGGSHPWLAHGNLGDVRDSLRVFYARRDNRAAWLEGGRPSERARNWMAALEQLDDYGVPPADVDIPQLADRLAELEAGGSRGPLELEDIDVAMSAAVARALRALHSGRVLPATVDSTLILLHRPLALGLTLDSLLAGGDPRVWMERVQPSFRQYWMLLQALARYRDFAGDGDRSIGATPPRLTIAKPSGDIARLKLLLERVGDLKWGTVRGAAADSVSDAKLLAAIGRFQRRHHLSPSGRLDSATWEALHGAMDERVAEMGRTLEQFRWLPHELVAPLLMVNIPAFKLEAMSTLDEPDSSVLHIDVVVGTAYKTQTPVLTAALTSIDFMPTWDVPPSIQKAEVSPAALKDSSYLSKNHMDLIRDTRIVPASRKNIERIGNGVRVRQRCGPDNPLGRVKFVMPNRYDIYLHDTPSKHLFGARTRDFSHGCIRLGNPVALARYALRDRPDWTPARIDSAMQGSETVKVRLPIPMLVAIIYATVEARSDGKVLFHPDVYGHDRTLELLLAGAPRDSVRSDRWRAMAARHRLPKPVTPLQPEAPHAPGLPAPTQPAPIPGLPPGPKPRTP